MFLDGKKRLNQCEKALSRGIFRDKMIRLALESRLPVFREVITCQDDDDDIRIGHFDLLGKLKPVFFQQPDIYKNEVGRKGIKFREKLTPVRFSFNFHCWKPGM
jgi:hypothetical protein